MKKLTLLIGFFMVLALLAGCQEQTNNNYQTEPLEAADTEPALKTTTETYNPAINPEEFSNAITNPYFSMPAGKKMVYEAHTEDGIERIEILIPGWTKEVMGVQTLVFWDRVYLDGELIEDTRDYLAQDKEGNVWYFGEDVDNYAGGILLDHHGSWIGGVDGAVPGIWMPAQPEIGKDYPQEYYAGEAEDMARVEEAGISVQTNLQTYQDCLKIFEWTPLEDATAYKYHCAEVSATVLEVEEEERVELIEVNSDGSHCIVLPQAYANEGVISADMSKCTAATEIKVEETKELVTEITEAQAKAIALEQVPGKVTDIEIEKKQGKLCYVVEVDPDYGRETDVIIDIKTGEVLAIEK